MEGGGGKEEKEERIEERRKKEQWKKEKKEEQEGNKHMREKKIKGNKGRGGDLNGELKKQGRRSGRGGGGVPVPEQCLR